MNFGKYRIPEENMPRLTTLVEKLNRRARRLSLDGIHMVIVEREMVESPDGKSAQAFIHVELTGTAPKLNGWMLAAIIEHTPEGNMVRVVPNVEIGDVIHWRTTPPWCMHCQTRRNRRDTFLVLDEQGAIFEVGSNCLKDFLGHTDPHAIASWAELLGAFEYDLNAMENERDFDPEAYRYIPARYFLGHVAAIVRVHGWLSRGKAREQYGDTSLSTADRALDNMRPGGRASDKVDVEEADEKTADSIMAWAETALFEADPDSLDDYRHNLRIAMRNEYLEPRDAGIFASCIAAFRRDEADRERRENAPESKPVGTVKKRDTFGPLEVRSVASYDSAFGIGYVYNFIDADDNRLVWFTGTGIDAEKGDTVTIKATVKDHVESKFFRGIETIVSRVSLVKKEQSIE